MPKKGKSHLPKKLITHLKKLRNIYHKTWNPEFKARYLTPQPEGPLPEPEMEPMVNLGCVNGSSINDLVTVGLSWPINYDGSILQDVRLTQLAQTGQYTIPDPNFPGTIFDTVGSETNWNLIQQDLLGHSPYVQGIANASQADINLISSVSTSREGMTCIGIQGSQSGSALCSSSSTPGASGRFGTTRSSLIVSQPSPVPNPPSQLVEFEGEIVSGSALRNRQEYLNSVFGRVTNSGRPLGEPRWQGPFFDNNTRFQLSESASFGSRMSFQNNVYLSSNIDLYSNYATSIGYTSVPLAQEGLLWTLWPLSRLSQSVSEPQPQTYFDGFQFGTSTRSQYAIGQLGYFINNRQIGCVPLNNLFPVGTTATIKVSPEIVNITQGSSQINNADTTVNIDRPITIIDSLSDSTSQSGLGILPGIQGLNSSLITTTQQMVALVVIKVTEQVARIPNPAAGVSSINKFIYVGYDGWSVVRTTMNPLAPMAAQTYITPQSVTGSVVGDNYQVVFPPNFPQAIFYKNYPRTAPTNTEDGLFSGAPLATSTTTKQS